jgi:hypothetical protein
MNMVCERHVQSIDRIVSFYINLSWYKKLFFPKRLSFILQSLFDARHRGYSLDNSWMLVGHLLSSSRRFQTWFDEIDDFLQTPLMQACMMMKQQRALTRESFGQLATHHHPEQLSQFLQLFQSSNLSMHADAPYCIQFMIGYLNHHFKQDINYLLQLLIQMNQEGFFRPFYCQLVLNSQIQLNDALQLFLLVKHLDLSEEAFRQMMLSWGANFRRSLMFNLQQLFSNTIDYDDLLYQVVNIKEPMQVLNHLEELVAFGLMQDLTLAQHFYLAISNCDAEFIYRDDICQALKYLHQQRSLSLQLGTYNCLKLIQARSPSEMAELLTDPESILCLQQSPHAETFLEIMHQSILPKNTFYCLLNMEKQGFFEGEKGQRCFTILLNARQEPASLSEAILRLHPFDLLSHQVFWTHLKSSKHPHLWGELLIMLCKSELFDMDSLVAYSEIITQLDSFDMEHALSKLLTFKLNEDDNRDNLLPNLKDIIQSEPANLAYTPPEF